nr:PIG-L family deacetylase [Pseudonocardia sp. C8]
MAPRHAADVWDDATTTLAFRDLDPSTIRRLVVVSTHPDDGPLGAGGLMRAVTAAGGTVELVVAGDGGAAPPGAGRPDRAGTGRTCRAELDEALAELGVPAQVDRLGPALHEDDLAAALGPRLAGADAWVGPWRGDPHPDHAAVGRACVAAATTHGYGFPVRARTRCDPTDPDVPWDRAHRLTLSPADRAAKARAAAAHTSRCRTPPGATRAVLSPAARQHCRGAVEVYFRELPPGRNACPAGAPGNRAADADPYEEER